MNCARAKYYKNMYMLYTKLRSHFASLNLMSETFGMGASSVLGPL